MAEPLRQTLREEVEPAAIADLIIPRALDGETEVVVRGDRRLWVGDTLYSIHDVGQEIVVTTISRQWFRDSSDGSLTSKPEDNVQTILADLAMLASVAITSDQVDAYVQTVSDILLDHADDADLIRLEEARLWVALIDNIWRARFDYPKPHILSAQQS